MNLSYWEIKTWLSDIDFLIVGSGIVGLSCALRLRKMHPKSKILILDKGMLPEGASTKNAGFACFGSLSEVIDDLQTHSEEEVFNLVKQRWEGLQLLRETLSDEGIKLKKHGGYELFLKSNPENFETCHSQMAVVNKLLRPLFGEDVYSTVPDPFRFKGCVETLFYNMFEAQIDTGQMMDSLLRLVQSKHIRILNNTQVLKFTEDTHSVHVETPNFEIATRRLVIATNGFSGQLFSEQIKPARAQVLITKPIDNLHIKGTFHLDTGYYYFRNIDNRILLGGGRNLDFKTEETTEFGQTELVQNQLDLLLRSVILPETSFEIEHRWSGIMGVGDRKQPIVKKLSERVLCGVRLGGMGIAIGSSVGKKLAELIDH